MACAHAKGGDSMHGFTIASVYALRLDALRMRCCNGLSMQAVARMLGIPYADYVDGI